MSMTDETSPPPPPPPPAGEPPGRRLTRTPDDKVFTGLCGGLGRYFSVDPVIFRIGFVVLSLAGGTGLLLYLAGWLLVPDAATGVTEADRLLKGRHSNVVLVVLALIAGAVFLDQFDDGPGDFFVAVTLIGVGAAVLWSRRNQTGGAAPPSAPQPGDAPPPSSPRTVADAVADAVPPPRAVAPPVAAPPPPTAAPPPPRPRSVLVPVTLSLASILVGVLALAGWSLGTLLAAALVALGLGLMVGAWRGRGRALIPFGLVLVPALVAGSFIDVPLRGGIGDRAYRPLTVTELDSPYRLAAGELEVDLSRIDLAGRTVPVVVSNGLGELRVLVPAGAAVEVRAHAGAGEVRVFGRSSEGTDVDERFVSPGTGAGGRLVVSASVGIGEVEVIRRAAA